MSGGCGRSTTVVSWCVGPILLALPCAFIRSSQAKKNNIFGGAADNLWRRAALPCAIQVVSTGRVAILAVAAPIIRRQGSTMSSQLRSPWSILDGNNIVRQKHHKFKKSLVGAEARKLQGAIISPPLMRQILVWFSTIEFASHPKIYNQACSPGRCLLL